MHLAGRIVPSLVGAAMALAGLAVGACGGGDGEPARRPAVTQREGGTPPASPAARTPSQSPELGRRASPGDEAHARELAKAYLASLGFDDVSVRIGRRTRALTVSIGRREACGARPRDVRLIHRQLRFAARPAPKVRVTAGGDGISLRRYLASHCKRRSAPHGRGRLIYARRGSGIVDTPGFRVRSPRWRIEFENYGAVLQVFLYRGDRLLSSPVHVDRRISGVRTVRGRGRFRLRIAGSGEWAVRVRAGER